LPLEKKIEVEEPNKMFEKEQPNEQINATVQIRTNIFDNKML
jgi:hypothetical protein